MGLNWWLERMSGYSNDIAMIFEEGATTYRELLQLYEKWRSLLRERHVEPGEVIALKGEYSPQSCAAMFALIANGNIIVPVASAVEQSVAERLEIANVSRCITVYENRMEVESFSRRGEHELLHKLIAAHQAGLILFTSGSTGAPKGIVHNFTKFLEKYKPKKEALRTLTFLLMDHVGGLNTLFHTLINGGTIICPNKRQPDYISALIEKHRVELLPTTPSFLNLLLMTEQYNRYDLSSLKIITYGTEVMPEQTLAVLRRCLPNVELRQTYGLSELGILRAKSASSDSLWVKIGGEGYQTKVVDGVLFIKAESAMEGYLNAPDPFDQEGWFNTQDQVKVDGGFIRLLGRSSEIINVGGQKVYPAEVEEVLMQMPEIIDVVVKGEQNAILGHVVTAVVNLHENTDAAFLRARVKKFCQGLLDDFKIPVKIKVQEKQLISERYKKLRR